MIERLYCTQAELVDDLHLAGSEPRLTDRIEAASAFIERRIGNFIPITATRTFDGANRPSIQVRDLLAAATVTYNGTAWTSTQYNLYPLSRCWQNGPYSRIEAYQASFAVKPGILSILGRWGLYEETLDLGVTGTQADTTGTSLAVANGSLLSPGMLLVLGTEQEQVLSVGATTAATSLLNGTITATDENITVDNGAEFFAGEVIRLGTEDCYIRAIVGHILVTTRGWNGTTRAAHLDDLAIGVYRTYTVKRGVSGTTAATHAAAAISRYVVPPDVNWLVRQIASLMRMKAASGFAGKTGNAELGETFYFNEFPSQIKEIRKNYRIASL